MRASTLAIYPTAIKATDQLTRMSRDGCVLGSRVTTLPQVFEALWRECGDPRTSLSAVGERLVLLEAMAEGAPGSTAATSGMADRLLALIRQLKSAALTATDWAGAYTTLPAAGQAPLAVFTPVFAAYAKLLVAHELADRHDREAAALGWLHRMEREGRRPQYLEGVERLLVAEIYDLSLLQFMTVAALIRLIGDAQLTIQAEPQRVDASRFADLTWNRFAGEESIADQVLPEFVRRTGRPGRLGFALEHLFTGAYPPPPDPDGTVTVVEAPNPRGETEAVARAIRRLLECDDSAIQLDRIAIVARDLTPYRDYLEAAFRRYRIPLVIAIGPPLRAAGPARALLQLIAIPLEDYPRDALLALCASPYAYPAAASYPELLDDAGYLDRPTRCLAECFERRRRELASPAVPSAGVFGSGDARRERLRRGAPAWVELLDALATLEPPATMAEHLARLTALLSRIGFDPMAGALTGASAPGAAALWRILDELAVEAPRAAPRRTLTLREFAAALEAALNDTAVTSGVAEGGAVRALPLRDARGLDFARLFILGLNDGMFPRYSPEDPLVPDPTAITLNRALRSRLARRFGDRAPDAPGAILRTRGQRNSEEPFLFFLALSMPERAVVFSCSKEDESGRPLARSPFLDEVTRLLSLRGNLDENCGCGPLAGWQENREETWENCFDEREFLNLAAARGALTDTFAAESFAAGRIQSIVDRIAIERQRARYFAVPTREEMLELQHRGGKTDDNAFTGMLTQPGSVKTGQAGAYDGRVTAGPRLTSFLLDEDRAYRWSAAQLTELASCGFKFFAHRLLKLRDDDDVDHAPTRLETGELVHGILRDYFDAQPDFSRPEAALALLAEVAEAIRDRERGAARDPVFFDLEWATITAMLDEIVRYEIARWAKGSPPTQILHEFAFDFVLAAPATDPAAPRASAGSPITIQGRIDRLELYRGGAGLIERLSVIDYKASNGLQRLARMLQPDSFATSDLQMPVYLLGAVDHFRAQLAPGATVQASYIALKHRDKETIPLVVPFDLLEPAARRPGNVAARVRELVGDALDGRFDVDPLECSDWCPYRPVCRFKKGSAQ